MVDVATLELKPWQEALAAHLANGRDLPEINSHAEAARFNELNGVTVRWGKDSGHTLMAAWVLNEYPGHTCVIVPTARDRGLIKRLVPHLEHRIWVSQLHDGGFRFQIMEKTIEPLMSSDICVVDNASKLSMFELTTIRCATWRKLIELN